MKVSCPLGRLGYITQWQPAGGGGQVSTASKQWRVGLRQQQQPRRRWQPAGEAYPHGPHEAAIVG